ncbi:PD-(D/E)XK nuclease family protein [Hypericibacter adhaerens]|uniref:PD-(D/E)XK nuclease family protein n=1 Tax=Hypericibacter adhaerens TaxID=2602016 RepID=UPI002D7E78C6|nr:PD-(D/E)XK nuclease family protein [Hypericibacter adhaerens]
MSRRHLYTIAPNAPFLPMLVERVLDGTLLNGWERSNPFWLSDITIILPTRRARLTLAELFAQRLGGAALLPDIRTFGGENAEEEPFLPPVDAATPPPAATRLERRLTLSRLVRAYVERAEGYAAPPNAAEILWLADSLGELIDDFTIEGAEPQALRKLVPEDLAGNWQQLLGFLDIVFTTWPQVLAARGQTEAAAARNDRLRRQAATAPLVYGDRPVIAAGSTGSIPATADLLKAIAALPRGAVVLPGLDTTLSPAQHQALLEGEATQSHPQYGLAVLLRRLGAGIADVEELAPVAERTELVRHALAPAGQTGAWGAMRANLDVGAALDGVGIIAAPTADLEARAVALAARQAVMDRQSVGIVTRDQTLARRISAELNRHGIEVDDPAGTPLYQSAAGRLARQILAAAAGQFAPVDLVALLRNAAVTLGRDRGEVQKLATRLDLKLRRERTLPGLAGVLELAGDDDLRALVQSLGEALEPVLELIGRPRIDARQLAGALEEALLALIDGADMPGLVEFRDWSRQIAGGVETGADFAPANLDGVLKALMEGEKVPPAERRRDDVHIWGELEARLMNPDLLIVAGLNEDIWPAPADPGPWMNRRMRMGIGLEPPERQQGLAAHDFEMAMGNRRVMLAFATRLGTAPARPSRLVQRLDAFIGEAMAQELRARGRQWLDQAAAIDFAGLPRPARRPEPMPPAGMRPRALSVTEIETLMRSPYDIYARHVLGLRPLDPLGAEPSARERGTMIHAVFEQFVREGLSFTAEDAAARLEAMAKASFSTLESIAERREIWLERFGRAAEQFLDWERSRHGRIAARAAEITGEWTFPSLQNFVLKGKADRIDQRTDGLLEILDFKTGGVPLGADMKAFEAPQLLLEAAMARAGAFPGIPRRDTAALFYIKIGLGPDAFSLKPFSLRKDMHLMQAVDEIERRMQGHIEAFLIRDDLPMLARLKPREQTGRRPRPGDYDHLARTDEWTLTAGVDDP